MGLITLRPFPHVIATTAWRYFHASSYRYAINPGPQITTTVNDLLWTEVPTPSLTNLAYEPFKVVGFVYSNNKLVIGQTFLESKFLKNEISAQTLVWQSYDGVNWNQTVASNHTSAGIASNNSGLFVSVNIPPKEQSVFGTMISTTNKWSPISTSTDGFNWFEQDIPLPIEDQYSQILYDNTEFKAIGNATILRSTDGVNWSQQPVNFPKSYYTYVKEEFFNSILPFSNVAHGEGKYVYVSLQSEPVGTCAADVLNVSNTGGFVVTNNTAYGCNWIVGDINSNCTININNSSYTDIVVKLTLKSNGLIDYRNIIKIIYPEYPNYNFFPLYKDYISGNKERIYFFPVNGGSTRAIQVEMWKQMSATLFDGSLPSVEIEAYPNYYFNIVAHSTTDFITFNTSVPIIHDVRHLRDRIVAFGYSQDRWVLWYNAYVSEDGYYYDYVVYSLDGINWQRASSFNIARTNFVDPGFAEIYPSFTSHDSINKTYKIGYSGGSIMTSSDGINWTGWMPTPLTIN